MFEAIDHWARTVPPSLALRPASAATGLIGGRTSSLPAGMQPLPPPRESASGRQAQGSRRGSTSTSTSHPSSSRPSSSRPSSQGSVRSRQHSAKVLAASPGGAPAVAARLAVGCCQEAPWRQLQLLRACYCWVLTHVHLPRDCSVEAGADLVTWDVGRHLFGEDAQHRLLHEVRELWPWLLDCNTMPKAGLSVALICIQSSLLLGGIEAACERLYQLQWHQQLSLLHMFPP